MSRKLSRVERYSSVAIAFHWTIAVLVIFNLWLGIAHDGLPRDWQVMPVHKAVGITVLFLTLGRIWWRVTHRPPALLPNGAKWERSAAHWVHWIFYALLIIMPLTGWAMSSVGRNGGPPRPLTFFFLFDIPYLPVSAGVASASHNAHGLLGYIMVALVALHIVAALRHHLILRDSTLARMLPIIRAPSGS